jgi:hypothetical protein
MAEARRLRDLLAVKEKELHDLKDRVTDLEKQLRANQDKMAATVNALRAYRSHAQQLQDQAERARAAESEARKRADQRASDSAARQTAQNAFVRGLRRAGEEEPAPRAGSPSSPRLPADQVEQARDEVEILAAQVNIKRAHLEAAKQVLDITNRVHRNSGFDAKGQLELASLAGQVQVKEAELKESEVRLVQATRRLDKLKKSAKGGEASNRGNPQRTADLEKRLDALGKELDALRRELKVSGPSHP